MSETPTPDYDALRESLIDFAKWLGQPAPVAEWSATRYMEESGKAPLGTPHPGGCPTPDCPGDSRYGAPGRSHREGCTYPTPPEVTP